MYLAGVLEVVCRLLEDYMSVGCVTTTRIVGGVGCQGWRYYVVSCTTYSLKQSMTTSIHDQWLYIAPVVIFLSPQEELVRDAIAVQKSV